MAETISLENVSLAEIIRLRERLWNQVSGFSGDARSFNWH